MKNKLFRSVIILVIFYMIVGNLAFMFSTEASISDWVGGRKIDGVDRFSILFTQLDLIRERAREVGLWFLLGGTASFSFVLFALIWKMIGINFERTGSSWKTLKVSMSDFPEPLLWDGERVEVNLKKGGYKGHYHDLLCELMSYAKENEDHFVGEGHGDVGLLEHTINVMNRAAEKKDAHKLLVLAAAAHDLGKTKTFTKTDKGEWVRVKLTHDVESAKIIRSMPAWDTLPEPDRRALYLAVKYEHHPDRMPTRVIETPESVLKSALKLMDQLREIDGLASADEADGHVENHALKIEKAVLDAVREFVSDQSMGMVDSADHLTAFSDGENIFILEHALREHLNRVLGKDISVPMGLQYKSPNKVSNGTMRVAEILYGQKILLMEARVRSGDKYKIRLDWPLWDIQVGGSEFKAVIGLVISKLGDVRLPKARSDIDLLGPWKRSKAEVVNIKEKTPLKSQSVRIDGGKSSEKKMGSKKPQVAGQDKGKAMDFGEKPRDLF